MTCLFSTLYSATYRHPGNGPAMAIALFGFEGRLAFEQMVQLIRNLTIIGGPSAIAIYSRPKPDQVRQSGRCKYRLATT